MGRKTRMRPLRQTRDQGWGLFEILLAIVLTAIISGVVAMGARQALDSANARDCSKNLALIEAAKDEFSRDNPGVPLTSESQLARYLKYGMPFRWNLRPCDRSDPKSDLLIGSEC